MANTVRPASVLADPGWLAPDDRRLDEERSDERRLFAPRFTDFVILNVHEDIGAGLKVRQNIGGERIKPNPTDFKNSAAGAGLAATCRRQPRLPDWLGARQ